MEFIALKLVAMPIVLRYAIFVGLSILCGFLVSRLLRRKSIMLFLTLGFLAGFFLLAQAVRPQVKYWLTYDLSLQKIEDIRLFHLLMKRHPEIRQTLRSQLEQLVHLQLNTEQTSKGIYLALQDVMNEYLRDYVLKAPDEAVYAMLRTDFDSLQALKRQPTACVNYFLSRSYLDEQGVLPAIIFLQQTDNRADLVEQAGRKPTPLATPLSPNAIISTLADTYQKLGRSPELLAQVGNIPTMEPAEGCETATLYLGALLSLEPQKTSTIYKSLLSLQALQPTTPSTGE